MKIAKQIRKVLITGGTGSVGTALVQAFAASGDSVWFQYHRESACAKSLQKKHGARPIQLDFARHFLLPESDFDIVVNNAGINISDASTHEVTDEAWNLTIQVNLTAPFQIVKQCLPSMIRKEWGRIINISSIYGLRAVQGNFPYTVSKHGLTGLTTTVAKEYAHLGITCNEICPGPIDSDMMREIAAKVAAGSGQSSASYLKEVCDEVPAKRMAEPDEIASLAVFLASPLAAYINGASIPVDGAMIA